jgi:hypothetical protein
MCILMPYHTHPAITPCLKIAASPPAMETQLLSAKPTLSYGVVVDGEFCKFRQLVVLTS